MKNYLNSILAGFEYAGIGDFLQSLLPTMVKHKIFAVLLVFTIPATVIEGIFGLDFMAVGALLVVMVMEIASGTYASHLNKQEFSSRKLSRFTFKAACYLVLIAVPYLFYSSYIHHGNTIAASIFKWLHVFMVVQIVLENIFSILENVAVIQGKPKTYWVDKIKDKINISFS